MVQLPAMPNVDTYLQWLTALRPVASISIESMLEVSEAEQARPSPRQDRFFEPCGEGQVICQGIGRPPTAHPGDCQSFQNAWEAYRSGMQICVRGTRRLEDQRSTGGQSCPRQGD